MDPFHYSFFKLFAVLCLLYGCAATTTVPLLPPSSSAILAADTLRSRGYSIFAGLLVSMTATTNFSGTLLAPPDSVFSFASSMFLNNHRPPPRPSIPLLLYHTLSPPLILTWPGLSTRDDGDELRTYFNRNCLFLLRSRSGDVSISSSPFKNPVAGVKIRQPDLYVDQHLTVHGIDGVLDPSFATKCSVPYIEPMADAVPVQVNRIFVDRALRRLWRKGYNVVAAGMLVRRSELLTMTAVTVFAVSDENLFVQPGGFHFDFRHHVVPMRLRFSDLEKSAVGGMQLFTLAANKTVVVRSVDGVVNVDGVAMKMSEVYHNRWIVVLSIMSSLDDAADFRRNPPITGADSRNLVPSPAPSTTNGDLPQIPSPSYTNGPNVPSPAPASTEDSRHILVTNSVPSPSPFSGENRVPSPAPASTEDSRHILVTNSVPSPSPFSGENRVPSPAPASTEDSRHILVTNSVPSPSPFSGENRVPSPAPASTEDSREIPITNSIPSPSPFSSEDRVPSPAPASTEDSREIPITSSVPSPSPLSGEDRVPSPAPASTEDAREIPITNSVPSPSPFSGADRVPSPSPAPVFTDSPRGDPPNSGSIPGDTVPSPSPFAGVSRQDNLRGVPSPAPSSLEVTENSVPTLAPANVPKSSIGSNSGKTPSPAPELDQGIRDIAPSSSPSPAPVIDVAASPGSSPTLSTTELDVAAARCRLNAAVSNGIEGGDLLCPSKAARQLRDNVGESRPLDPHSQYDDLTQFYKAKIAENINIADDVFFYI